MRTCTARFPPGTRAVADGKRRGGKNGYAFASAAFLMLEITSLIFKSMRWRFWK